MQIKTMGLVYIIDVPIKMLIIIMQMQIKTMGLVYTKKLYQAAQMKMLIIIMKMQIQTMGIVYILDVQNFLP